MEKFDPMLGANKSKKELGKEVVKNEDLAPVYNPKTGEFDLVEDLSFAKDGGNIILEKGEGKGKIAKTQILPLKNILEAGKKIIKEAEEFPEDIEE